MAKTSFTAPSCKIKAIGVGGGGSNAVNRMVRADVQGVEFIAVNTDAQALMMSDAQTRIQIGEEETRGLGVGGNPERGRKAALTDIEQLRGAVSGAEMVFVTVGMGGGTGTGAAPVIAKLAKESGALTIGIVTKPFKFELARRMQQAEEGIDRLSDEVDAIIVIPNERLLALSGEQITVDNAFKMADDVLMTAVRTISEAITVPGLINIDFADVKSIMKDAGPCWLSIAYAGGQDRTAEAARSAISAELIDIPIDGATGILYIISGAKEITLHEVEQAADIIRAAASPEANIIFGVTIDPSLGNNVRISLVATGFTSVKQVMQTQKDDEFRQMLVNLGRDEKNLETPAYMRRP
ncbi:cell division protein FtsZ, partial [Chloroflexota bacterium]